MRRGAAYSAACASQCSNGKLRSSTSSGCESEIWLTRNGRRVNAKSIMGVMMLAAAKGSTVLIETAGTDEEQAIGAVTDLIANRFGENE
jgi:phosphocarrier protein HPr